MFKRFKIILTAVLFLSILGGIPLPSHQFSPAHQAQAGPLKWAAKKAIGGLVKIAIIKAGGKLGKAALFKLKKIGKDKVKRANIIKYVNNYLKKHPKLRNQATIAFATIGWQLEAGSDLPGLGGIASKSGGLLPKSLTAKQLRNKAGSAYGTKGLRYIKDGDKWLRGSHGSAGNIPKQVADKLSGRKFKSFDEFRSSFWKEVSKDSNLTKSFNKRNVARMRSGKAPIAHPSQHIGSVKSYQLHHKKPISQSGAVYNMDNMTIVTPRYHKDILSPSYHAGGLK